jgi:hypothetical protein
VRVTGQRGSGELQSRRRAKGSGWSVGGSERARSRRGAAHDAAQQMLPHRLCPRRRRCGHRAASIQSQSNQTARAFAALEADATLSHDEPPQSLVLPLLSAADGAPQNAAARAPAGRRRSLRCRTGASHRATS